MYSAQSKTYDRVYVLAPVQSGLVNGQNYYTAITRARYGVKLWTQNPGRLAARLEQNSGEKTSALEGLGRLSRDHVTVLGERHASQMISAREDQQRIRFERGDRRLLNRSQSVAGNGLLDRLAGRALSITAHLDRLLRVALVQARRDENEREGVGQAEHSSQPVWRDHSKNERAGKGPVR